ncbi:MAG TPA: FkbM family methyltransferase [Chitinophagales bacterium]|nr:FkbM family methyltransferase [Chitinophagales bacterium]
MPSALSIKLGDFLYKNAFPVYNILYPVFKRKQDKHEIELLHKNIRKGDIVLDIGANIGFYTQLLSDLVGENGKVYAFEPDKKNYSYLQQNTGQLKNVAFFHKAVSNKTGNLTCIIPIYFFFLIIRMPPKTTLLPPKLNVLPWMILFQTTK